MINEQAANASRTAKTLTALYTRLDIARECITLALDSLPNDFDIHQTGRINDIRNILSREMSRIWDLRESEERRLCEQTDSPTPPEPQMSNLERLRRDPNSVHHPKNHQCPEIGPCPYCPVNTTADDPKDSLRFPVEPETLNEALDVAYTATEILCEMESNQRQSDPNETLIKSQLFNEYIRTKKSTCYRLVDKLKQILGIR